MLEPIVSFFDKLIENFSWRRLLFLLAVLVVGLLALWAYESYTSTFRLARIEKQAVLLERVATVAGLPSVRSSPALNQAAANLQNQLLSTTRSDDSSYELLPWGKKVLSAAAAWMIFALFILLLPETYGSSSKGSAFMGMVVVAAPFVALAAAIPTFEASWINYLGYPVGHIVLLVVLILWLQRHLRRRALTRLFAGKTPGA